jgi:hypothetical protein
MLWRAFPGVKQESKCAYSGPESRAETRFPICLDFNTHNYVDEGVAYGV